jgi:electron transport complex protein RnfD
MLSVVAALMPSAIIGMIYYGWWQIGLLIVIGILSAVLSEALLQKWLHIPLSFLDGSAALTGLLLVLTISPASPWWIPIIGSFVAILSKQVFGGLGQNPFNPALIGRATLLLSFPIESTQWIAPFSHITTATPLNLYKMANFGTEGLQQVIDSLGGTLTLAYRYLFLGFRGGSIGEVCFPAMLAGFLFLLLTRVVSWRITLSYLLTVVILALLFHLDIVIMLLSGGIVFGAFFMATDYATSPLLPKNQIIFGIGVGFINMVIRRFSGMPEGTTFAILIMNIITPLLDQSIKKPVGFIKEMKKS